MPRARSKPPSPAAAATQVPEGTGSTSKASKAALFGGGRSVQAPREEVQNSHYWPRNQQIIHHCLVESPRESAYNGGWKTSYIPSASIALTAASPSRLSTNPRWTADPCRGAPFHVLTAASGNGTCLPSRWSRLRSDRYVAPLVAVVNPSEHAGDGASSICCAGRSWSAQVVDEVWREVLMPDTPNPHIIIGIRTYLRRHFPDVEFTARDDAKTHSVILQAAGRPRYRLEITERFLNGERHLRVVREAPGVERGRGPARGQEQTRDARHDGGAYQHTAPLGIPGRTTVTSGR